MCSKKEKGISKSGALLLTVNLGERKGHGDTLDTVYNQSGPSAQVNRSKKSVSSSRSRAFLARDRKEIACGNGNGFSGCSGSFQKRTKTISMLSLGLFLTLTATLQAKTLRSMVDT